ncbi:Uu.00g000610.m01.CDS01 [Anthostomella pinea]|uniref:Uu.00g000610.m01.CDS01 n=1 Tax=Anthostomella pinea TaxID=933095 RepID=A0AAI8VJU9_9PEZI|nr:Uu.00g000610.m01.CDS01 [Anthostomella pinea]
MNAKEGDTVWLEIIHAMTLTHQGKHAPERYATAEKELRRIIERFRRIEATGSWYDEQIRHFAIKCSLAQIAHMQHDWEEAQRRWADVVAYGMESVTDWKGENYYIEVAKYSLADAQCSADMDPRVVIPPLVNTIRAIEGKRVTWMLGMGTFWLDYVHERMAPMADVLSKLNTTDTVEAKLAVLSVVAHEL